MFVYLCPVLSICSATFDLMYGWLITLVCSLYLVVNNLPICRMQNLLQSLQVSLYTPVLLNSLIFCELLLRLRCFLNVLIVLYAILYFDFLNV